MDYLKILHEDSNFAADFDALFDFFLLDEPNLQNATRLRGNVPFLWMERLLLVMVLAVNIIN